jgi:hypothetical protein
MSLAGLYLRGQASRQMSRRFCLASAPVSSASRDSAYPARGSTHSRTAQGAHLAPAATRGNLATRGGASAARNCARGIALPGWPRAGAANRSSPLIGRCPARIVARSISASPADDSHLRSRRHLHGGHDILPAVILAGAMVARLPIRAKPAALVGVGFCGLH